MQNDNYIFFNARDAQVQVYNKNAFLGTASNSFSLARLLLKHNVTSTDTLMCSSSIDFASEEGFATDASAHALIEEALLFVAADENSIKV